MKRIETTLLGSALAAVLAFLFLPMVYDRPWTAVTPAVRCMWILLVPCAFAMLAVALVLQKRRGVKHVWASKALSKTTVLDGHYASGDCECFCFDRCSGPEEHDAPYRAYWARVRDGNVGENEEPPVVDESCRVYPRVLLPEGSDDRKGRWTITVTFEPEECGTP
jgi:hypothetical protein